MRRLDTSQLVCDMTLAAEIVWEAREEGDIQYGGGFKTGASGTDRTQHDGALISSAADLVCSDHAGPPFDCSSALGTFQASDVGMMLTITGTGDTNHFVPGIYEIASVTDANNFALTADPTDGANETGGDYRKGAFKTTDDLACASGSPTTLTTTVPFFAATDVGNVIRIHSGTNFTQDWYEIAAYASATSVTLDRTPISAGEASVGVGYIGGATNFGSTNLADELFEAMEPGNVMHVKKGTYTLTEAISVAKDGTEALPIRIIGYNSSRGDTPTIASGNQPVFATGALGAAWDDYWEVYYIDITGTANTNARADAGSMFYHCRSYNSSGSSFKEGFRLAGSTHARLVLCDAKSDNGYGVQGTSNSRLVANYIHHCDGASAAGINISTNFGGMVLGNIIANNTNGIQATSGSGWLVQGNTFKDNGNAAIKITTAGAWVIVNNIFDDDLWAFVADNGGTVIESIFFDYNVYNSAAGGDHSWDNKVSEDNSAKGANDITGDPVLGADFTVSSGSNVLAAALMPNTDISADLAAYKQNIGVDQDDNAGGGGAFIPVSVPSFVPARFKAVAYR